MELTKEHIREAITTIYGMMCNGSSDDEIMDATGLSALDFQKLRGVMLDAKADEVRARPTEHTYVLYMIEQTKNLKDLEEIVSECKLKKQNIATAVGAVKARSEILDKLITKGQEFGIIHKTPDKKEIVAGVLVADLSNRQLKKMITKELGHLNAMMKRYGDRSILDMDPGELHRGEKNTKMLEAPNTESAPPPSPPKTLPKTGERTKARPTSKRQKARTARRSAGRSVALPKAPI